MHKAPIRIKNAQPFTSKGCRYGSGFKNLYLELGSGIIIHKLENNQKLKQNSISTNYY